MRDFDAWLAGFRPSIADYKYYVDFDKVFNNVEAIKIPLNILNALIGSKNIEDEFRNILVQYPETLNCIPILLAKRELDIMAMDEEGQIDFHFDKPNCTNEDYVKFMRKTGLFDLMENHIVNNLVDYVTGIETGLDSNGRKNRGGHLMENLVEGFLCKAGLVIGIQADGKSCGRNNKRPSLHIGLFNIPTPSDNHPSGHALLQAPFPGHQSPAARPQCRFRAPPRRCPHSAGC